MSLLLIDGFDMYNGVGSNLGLGAKWSRVGTRQFMVSGRFGGQAFQSSPSGGTFGAATTQFAANSSLGLGIALFVSTFQTDNTIYQITFLSGATYTFGLQIRSDGSIWAYRATGAAAGTSLGSSAVGVIVLSTWHFLELALVIDNTVGSVTIKVDGATVLTLTGVDTNNVSGTANVLQLGSTGGNFSGGVLSWDDLYLTNGATLGERRVETLRAAADTAQKDFTPLTGTSNFAMVDETTVDGDTSYVQAAVVGNRDLYTLGPLSSTPTTIDAVQVVSFAEKTDATTRAIYNSVQSAGTDSDGSQFNIPASYGRFDRLLATDPNGGGAWTPSRVNGLLVGPKIAA